MYRPILVLLFVMFCVRCLAFDDDPRSVSYTHLDVYKRQMLYNINNKSVASHVLLHMTVRSEPPAINVVNKK